MEEIMKGRQEELSLDFMTAVRSCLAVLRTPYTNYKKLKTTLLTCPRSSQNWSQLSSSAALHWLPIDSWIQYKLASLCYSSLKPDCPWLPDWTWVYKPTWQLRSSFDTSILCLPSVCMYSLGQRPLFLQYNLQNYVIKYTHMFQIISKISPLQAILLTVCVRVCMHACVRECMCAYALCVCACAFTWGYFDCVWILCCLLQNRLCAPI